MDEKSLLGRSPIEFMQLILRSQDTQNDTEINENKTIILVVEDNYDMREYIKESLSDNYQLKKQ